MGQVSLLINVGSSLMPLLIIMTLHWILQSTMGLSPWSLYWKDARTFAKKVYKIKFYVLDLNIFLRSDI